jgi:hypothetical protein
MNRKRIAIGIFAIAVLVIGVTVYAQVKRPFRNGTVWQISFIRMKPGMDTAYLNYVAGQWKAEQEAQKKAGNILSYKVLGVEGHTTAEWNLMLMTEYKDLASMEASEDKADAVAQQVVGDDEKQRQGYREREAIREVVGTRLAREIILESK